MLLVHKSALRVQWLVANNILKELALGDLAVAIRVCSTQQIAQVVLQLVRLTSAAPQENLRLRRLQVA